MKTIGIIALSGKTEKETVQNAAAYLENKGYRVKLSANIYAENRYLAGFEKDKLNSLYDFFKDSETDIIMCARGGYGAIRLINNIDYELIKKHPKIFCGYSDVTALLLMIYKKTGLITYHGPMACPDFGNCDLQKIPEEKTFTETYFEKSISNNPLLLEGNNVYKTGTANGIIWGGNLATVVSLCGLNFIPDEDFIFFTEDVNEPVYKIDKMFTQLFNIEKFKQNCRGIVLGDFLNAGRTDWLEELFTEIGNSCNIPVSEGFKITHNKDKVTIPIGKNCTLDGTYLKID